MPDLPAGSDAIASEPPAAEAPAAEEPAAEAQDAPETAPAVEPTEPQAVEEPATPAESTPAEAAPAEAAPAAPPTTYVVVAGDNLWDVAERLYGDGERWRDIAAANPGIDPGRLEVGATLNLPPAN